LKQTLWRDRDGRKQSPAYYRYSLPEWLKNAIALERLTENMKETKGEQPKGTDAEACAYLNTASLTVPMDGDWSQIYLYIAGKTYTRWKKNEMPADIRVDSLNDYQSRELKRVKDWLYQKRIQTRQDRERAERREEKEEEEARKQSEQPALFEF
jgi:hypothetical protein